MFTPPDCGDASGGPSRRLLQATALGSLLLPGHARDELKDEKKNGRAKHWAAASLEGQGAGNRSDQCTCSQEGVRQEWLAHCLSQRSGQNGHAEETFDRSGQAAHAATARPLPTRSATWRRAHCRMGQSAGGPQPLVSQPARWAQRWGHADRACSCRQSLSCMLGLMEPALLWNAELGTAQPARARPAAASPTGGRAGPPHGPSPEPTPHRPTHTHRAAPTPPPMHPPGRSAQSPPGMGPPQSPGRGARRSTPPPPA